MKLLNTLLLTTALLIFSTSVQASSSPDEMVSIEDTNRLKKHKLILILGADSKSDNIWALKNKAFNIYKESIKEGFQQAGIPNFIISAPKHNAIFGIGGFVNFRTAYDWNNVIDNKDFVTYDVPMVGTPSNKQQLLMDARTSRLFFKTLVKTKKLGTIETYIEADFSDANYALNLREAYVSFKGFTFGQTTSTFVDLNSSVNTIDFQGPNAYTYNRHLMVRYHYKLNSNWEFAISAEMPDVSATINNTANAYIIPQRMPDIPIYAQYNWNEGKSHLRASGLLRTMHYYDNTNMSTENQIGWGAMLSGRIALCPAAELFGQVVYGEGIGNYINDLNGNGYDLVSNPNNIGQLRLVPAMGWLAGLDIVFAKKWNINTAYSQVRVFKNNDLFAHDPNTYRLSQYIVTNIFYNISDALNVGAEYLYGTRENMSGEKRASNRAQMQIQFTF